MNRRALVVNNPRPERLSDPYQDHGPERCAQILATADTDLEWQDFQGLFGPRLPAGRYEEVIYFLPLAFDYMTRHEADAYDMIEAVVGFCSDAADRLDDDDLLEAVRARMLELFVGFTSRFVVTHLDEATCRQRWPSSNSHRDFVENSDLVDYGICEVVGFERHRSVAEAFVASLAEHDGDSTKAAWFLEYARTRRCRANMNKLVNSTIEALVRDRNLLTRASEIVIETRVGSESSPTYWNETFWALGL